jgi:ribulose-phosphate 3-epimerase
VSGDGAGAAAVRRSARLRAGEVVVAPSILSADFGALADAAARVRGVTDWIHVDVMDGHFVPNLTVGPPVVAALRRHTDAFLDCHLMVSNPGELLDAFARAGASSCTVHVEVGASAELLEGCHALGMSAGIACNPETPLEQVLPVLDRADLLLVMTVHPGFGGQAFLPETLPKVAAARAALDRGGSSATLQVDGGIDVARAGAVVRAGARCLVAGSAVYGASDPAEAARRLLEAGRAALGSDEGEA